MGNSSRSGRACKAVRKPYPEFPLGPGGCGHWQKRIGGKLYYFGPWGHRVNGELVALPNGGEWEKALARYKAQIDDIRAGRSLPPAEAAKDRLTVAELCNHFRTAKLRRLKSGEIQTETYNSWVRTTDFLVAEFGKTRRVQNLAAPDFEALRERMAERWGLVRLSNEIVKVRAVFDYGYQNGLIDRKVRFGEFKRPKADVVRKFVQKQDQQHGKRFLEAAEIRTLLEKAAPTERAMILLGVNAGFNCKDVADLPENAVDLARAMITFPRTKTGVERECPLFPETVDALRASLAVRPEAKTDDATGKFFVHPQGTSWCDGDRAYLVTKTFERLFRVAGVHRKRIGFATLRHVFRTVADGARDQPAANRIMGHADGSMASVYREKIDEQRLRDVVEHVRRWLWPEIPRKTGRITEPVMPVTVVEFDGKDGRESRRFENVFEARRFYSEKLNGDKKPTLTFEEVTHD